MSFWEKIKQSLRAFMTGRNGADELSRAMLWTGLLLYLIGFVTGLGIFALLGFVSYVITIWRMFSRNIEKRREENRQYLSKTKKMRLEASQARVRFANRKKYKYFKCVGCKSWLRLPRGAGEVTVTCSRCHKSFKMKA